MRALKSLASSNSHPVVLMFTPGLLGGVDEASKYLTNAFSSNAFELRLVRTKGTSALLAPVVFLRAILTIVHLRITGQLAGAHLNMSWKGSAVRKSILASLLIALRVPYVIQVHSGGFASFLTTLWPPTHRFLAFIFAHAKLVAVLGSQFAEHIEVSLGVSRSRTIIIPNGVPAPTILSHAALPRHQPPQIVHIGRLCEAKGTFELIDALDSLRELQWTAVLAGDGELDEVHSQIDQLGMADRIIVRSWIDRLEVSQLLSQSQIFVLPSRNEAMSLSLLEAMSFGLTCITTNVGAHGEVIVDGQNGLIVDGVANTLASSLKLVLEDRTARESLGRAASITFTNRYDIKAVAHTWGQAYAVLTESEDR